MDKYEVRYMPLLPYIILLTFIGAIGVIYMIIETRIVISYVIFFVISYVVIYLLHVILGDKILAEISDEGINIIDSEEFIAWREVKSWDYTPAIAFKGLGFRNNCLRIETDGKTVLIKGFNQFTVLKYFKFYIPDRRQSSNITIFLFIICIVIILFIIFQIT